MSGNAADLLVGAISEWLAGHSSDEHLRTEVERVDTGRLEPDQQDAVAELLAELRGGATSPAELNMVARETLQALVLGA